MPESTFPLQVIRARQLVYLPLPSPPLPSKPPPLLSSPSLQVVWGQVTGRLPDPPPGSNVRIISLDQASGRARECVCVCVCKGEGGGGVRASSAWTRQVPGRMDV